MRTSSPLPKLTLRYLCWPNTKALKHFLSFAGHRGVHQHQVFLPGVQHAPRAPSRLGAPLLRRFQRVVARQRYLHQRQLEKVPASTQTMVSIKQYKLNPISGSPKSDGQQQTRCSKTSTKWGQLAAVKKSVYEQSAFSRGGRAHNLVRAYTKMCTTINLATNYEMVKVA